MGFMRPGPATLNKWSIIAMGGAGGCLHWEELVHSFIFGDRWNREESWSKAGIKALNPLCQIANMLSFSPQNKASVLGVGSFWRSRKGLVQVAPLFLECNLGEFGHSLHTHIYGALSTQVTETSSQSQKV